MNNEEYGKALAIGQSAKEKTYLSYQIINIIKELKRNLLISPKTEREEVIGINVFSDALIEIFEEV